MNLRYLTHSIALLNSTLALDSEEYRLINSNLQYKVYNEESVVYDYQTKSKLYLWNT